MSARRLESVQLSHPAGGHLRGAIDLTGTTSTLLYVHGFGSDHTGEKAQALHAACLAHGYSYAAFDFHAHGGSSGNMLDLRASRLLEDLDVIRDYLRTRGVERLFLVGSSMGGFASSWFALRRPDAVSAVALLAPAFHFLHGKLFQLDDDERRRWQHDGRRRFRNQWLDVELSWEFVAERDQFDPAHLAADWRTPALIFHGLNDDVVPWQDSLRLVEQSPFPTLELRLWRDGDHRLTTYRTEIAHEACRFFARHGV